ncbi:MAG: ABC transporter permease [Clostridia bacterium]|nr:ABC transporter permease [Clostridia bacterium]
MPRVLVMLKECVVMSLSNIMSNKLRSFLTVLGIMIGVSAVIALITTVSSFSGTLSSSFVSMGAGTLSVSVSGSDLKSGLSADDLTELTELGEVDGVTPNVTLRSRVSRGGKYKTNVSVTGKNYYFFYRTDGAVTRGRPVHPTDEENMTFVCLITQDMVTELFFGEDPVGETMYIDGIPFTVIGILSDTAQSGVTTGVMNGSASIIIPYTTALKMNNSSDVTSLTVYLSEGTDSETASAVLEEAMDAMFSYEDDCFTITTMSSIEDTMNTMLSMVSSLLAGIASIALIVGGIGIMNMMLTTVTERTMEIGLKKALGAMPWQIQLQFLIESFLLSMIGGVIGVITGMLLSLTLCQVMETSFSVSGGAIALGVGFSAAVGIVFGWVPARKASRLNPIDALRAA